MSASQMKTHPTKVIDTLGCGSLSTAHLSQNFVAISGKSKFPGQGKFSIVL